MESSATARSRNYFWRAEFFSPFLLAPRRYCCWWGTHRTILWKKKPMTRRGREKCVIKASNFHFIFYRPRWITRFQQHDDFLALIDIRLLLISFWVICCRRRYYIVGIALLCRVLLECAVCAARLPASNLNDDERKARGYFLHTIYVQMMMMMGWIGVGSRGKNEKWTRKVHLSWRGEGLRKRSVAWLMAVEVVVGMNAVWS